MELVLVSGLSGSGKSIALNMLEDLGYYCIDNLPASLLTPVAIRLKETGQAHYEHSAFGIDARSHPDDLDSFPDDINVLVDNGVRIRVLFLQTETSTLLKRFSETRRKHPLSRDDVPLSEAIALERKLLEPISRTAESYIDTTRTNLHQLRRLIRDRVGNPGENSFALVFQSFGFKNGVPSDVDFVFDARCLPNPYWEPSLRALTGRDQPVIDFLKDQAIVAELLDELGGFLAKWIPRFAEDNRSYLTIAVGCTGGQHRSVFLCERLAERFRQDYERVMIMHREQS